MKPFPYSRLCFVLGSLFAAGCAIAQTPLDEESPWPRERQTNGNKVVIHLPQVERWTSNSFVARAAVEITPAKSKKETLGVVWFDAHGSVDRATRMVTLDQLEISKARFPDSPGQETNLLALMRSLLPQGVRTVSLDYLITTLGFAQAAARQGPSGLDHTPPKIIWATNAAALILIDGDPVMRPAGDGLQRVLNTPALILLDQATSTYYIEGNGRWFGGPGLQGPWTVMNSPPPAIASLSRSTNAPVPPDEPPPQIFVSTKPAELIMTMGLPDYVPISGTALVYASDTESQLFYHNGQRQGYVLLSGRWFKADSLLGPWSYVAPRDLPDDFRRIPATSPKAIVLASVPGSPQADLSLVANSVPTIATVNRKTATLSLTYDGEPRFRPIEGTPLQYAANASVPVIQVTNMYYALDRGVWFVASNPNGTWAVATEVPEIIYSIPPSSPLYYVTYARVYDSSDDEVEAGYTAGYTGAYEDDGTVVYGTGYDYDPWVGDEYYGWGWSWGYGYVYSPWYQWWLWRPWWSRPGGLWAAVIDKVYDRWNPGVGVTPYDRGDLAKRTGPFTPFTGYPSLYGRFRNSPRLAPLAPPANTLLLNPYARPKAPLRPGEPVHGAQSLMAVRNSPDQGRDLYASLDGNVYQRRDNGWYRRQAGGNWAYAAPLKGAVQNVNVPAKGGANAAGRTANTITPVVGRAAANRNPDRPQRNEAPDLGNRISPEAAANLEREYYARALSQMRQQGGGGIRRGGGGFRRR
jgi:hypothetical protein